MKLTASSLSEGQRWLIEAEPRFARIFNGPAAVTFERKAAGFSGLMQSIVSQQLSTKAAHTIWHRLERADLNQATQVLKSSDEALKALGLSAQKVRYVRALAQADLNYDDLEHQSTDEVIATLIPIVGIGEWTAQMYALFALGHADVFATADLGLREGIKKLFDLAERPTAKQAETYALSWSPWRSVASLALWRAHDTINAR